MGVIREVLFRRSVFFKQGGMSRYFCSRLMVFGTLFSLFALVGCKTTSTYRMEADGVAETIIEQKQEQLLRETGDFSIERPSDILRRRLLIEQKLPYYGEASLGSDALEPVPHWPEKDYPKFETSSETVVPMESGQPLQLSLIQALQVAAQNSHDYQTKKEALFRKALDLDLEANDFGFIWGGDVQSQYTADKSGTEAVKGFENSGSLSLSKVLYNGVQITTALAIDLVKLLTQGETSSFGITGDASISIPLLRGAGKHIVTEPLTQAERNVVYAIYEFERYKKTFAVDIARNYLDVLRQLDQVDNNAESYRSLITSARRTRRLADAGRADAVDVGRAEQDELRARERWIGAMMQYENRLDSFKMAIGIPPDTAMELDRGELERLKAYVWEIIPNIDHGAVSFAEEGEDSADAEIVLKKPDRENAGPLEMDEPLAIALGFDHRVDLRISEGKVYDGQRKVVVMADALGAELTLFGQASFGESRSLLSAGLEDASLRGDSGIYTGLFTLDLPFERTAERNAYRNSLIDLEQAVRDFQMTEDDIKFSILTALRGMVEGREALSIQTNAVAVAEERVKSTEMFYEAGRTQLREVQDAQDSWLTTKNSLTAAVVDYRMAELEFQRDTGILKIDEKGLFVEYHPGGKENDQ
jgi:outer membrane protein TolC